MEMPEHIQQAISFVESCGLTLESMRDEDGFGSRVITYQNGIRVRMVNDRGDWFIEVSDSQQPDKWYDMALLRDFLGGSGSDELTVPEQAAILTSWWDTIRSMFVPAQTAESHRRLQQLREDRVKRWFPEWYK